MGRRRCRPRTCAPRSWRPCRAGSGRRRAALARASSCRCARCSTGSPPGSGCSRPRLRPRCAWPGPRCSRCWGGPSSLTVRRPWGPGSALLWRPPPRRPAHGYLQWRCWPRRWNRSWPPWCCSWTASGPRHVGCSWWPPRPPARRRPTGLPCWRGPWSASSAARRCCFRARPPARPWWPGPPPWVGAQLPAPARCCPALRPALR